MGTNIDELIGESTAYPRIYSPADNTLSYGASILSGLMPSQHGIGNYSKMPWNFDNEILNSKIINLPEILKENPKISCIIGLNTEPERLVEIRKNRMNSLKENKNKLYTDLDQIKKEVDMAKNTFKKYKWPFIDVTRKSVEETAASIIKIYEIYKENA